MKISKKIISNIEKLLFLLRPILIKFDFISVFIFFLIIFSIIHFSSENLFGGDDGYYHIAWSANYFKDGLSAYYNFGQSLNFTVFKDYPTDMWFLYHILLIPFSSLGISGLKIISSIFAAATFVVFYFLVKKIINLSHHHNVLWNHRLTPLFWTFFLFLSSLEFDSRLALTRPHILGIIFFLTSIYFILSKSYWKLFLTLIFYALSYEAAFLVFIPIILYAIIEYLVEKSINYRLLSVSFAGFCTGVIFHPETLNFLYSGIYVGFFQAILSVFVSDISQGVEIQAAGYVSFLMILFLALSFLIILIVLNKFDINIIRKNKILLYLGALVLFFMGVSFFISRTIEYYAPLAVLFTAFIFSNYFYFARRYLNEIDSFLIKPRYILVVNNAKNKIVKSLFLKSALICILFLVASGSFLFNVFSLIESNKNSPPSDKYREVGIFLKNNTPENSIIFNSSWDDFPQLYFWGDNHNIFIVGSGAVFMYEFDKKLYWFWHNLTQNGGMVCDKSNDCSEVIDSKEAKTIIRDVFDSNYIFIDSSKYKRDKFNDFLYKNSNDFELVYRDQRFPDVNVYRVKD